jgi:hypothetical protein
MQLLNAAAEFVVGLNALPRELESIPVALEACFSLSEHIANIERRVRRLGALDPKASEAEIAREFVAAELVSAWAEAKERAIREAKRLRLDFETPIAPEDVIVSPRISALTMPLSTKPGS